MAVGSGKMAARRVGPGLVHVADGGGLAGGVLGAQGEGQDAEQQEVVSWVAPDCDDGDVVVLAPGLGGVGIEAVAAAGGEAASGVARQGLDAVQVPCRGQRGQQERLDYVLPTLPWIWTLNSVSRR